MAIDIKELNVSNYLNDFLQNEGSTNENFLSNRASLDYTIKEIANCLKLTENKDDTIELLHVICSRLNGVKGHSAIHPPLKKLIQCSQTVLKAAERQNLLSSHSLHDAAMVEDLSLIKAILEKVPNNQKRVELLNQQDASGKLPLFYALHFDGGSEKFLKEVVHVLIEHKIPLEEILINRDRGRSLFGYCTQCAFSKDAFKPIIESVGSFDQIDLDGYCAVNGGNYLKYGIEMLFKDHYHKEMGLEPKQLNTNLGKLLFRIWMYPKTELDEKDAARLIKYLSAHPEVLTRNPNRAARWMASCLSSNDPLFFNCIDLLNEPGKQFLIYQAIEKQNRAFLSWAAAPENGWSARLNKPLGNSIPAANIAERQELANLTPLNLALNEGQVALAEYLLDLGASQNSLSMRGETTLEWLCNHTDKLQDVARIVPRLVQEGGDLHSKGSDGKNLLQGLLKTQKFEEIKFLISSGIGLEGITPGEWDDLLQVVLREKQLDLFELVINKTILEKGLIDTFSSDLITSINQISHQRWLHQILASVHATGFDLTATLDQTIKLKNLHLGAYLKSLGVKTSHALSSELEKSLDHHAAMLTSDHFSEAERKLLLQLDNKNAAHLFGDAFIKKMRDRGQKVEGNSPLTTLGFASALIDFFAASHAEGNLAQVEQLLKIKAKFDAALPLARTIAFSRGEEGLEAAGKALEQQFENLAVGDSFILPYGWSKPSGGHAMLLECHKVSENEFAFLLFNTGGGIGDFHETQFIKDKLFANTVRAYSLTLDAIKSNHLSTLLLEPKILGATRVLDPYGSLDVYNVLAPFQVDPIKEKELIQGLNPMGDCEAWMQAQLSGTCAFRSLLAFMRFYLGKDLYKEFLKVVKSDVMDMIIESQGGTLEEDEVLRKIVSKAIPQFANHALKEIHENQTDEAALSKRERELLSIEKQKGLGFSHFPKQESHLLAPSVTYDYETQTAEITKALMQQEAASVAPVLQNEFPSVSIPRLDNVKEATTLSTYLSDCRDFAETYTNFGRNCAPHLTDVLRDLGRLLLGENPLEKEIWDSLGTISKEDLEENYMKPLEALSLHLYYHLGTTPFPDPAQKVALYSALFITFKLATLAERGDSNLQTPPLQKLLLNAQDLKTTFQDPNLFILDPVLLQDIERLLAQPLLKEIGGLFDFGNMVHPGITLGERLNKPAFLKEAYLELTGVDYEYAHALFRTCTADENTLCSEELKATEERDSDQEKFHFIDQEKWNVTWAYLNKVPNYFNILRHMAIRARTDTLWAIKTPHSAGKALPKKILLRDHNVPNATGQREANVGFIAGGGSISSSATEQPHSYTLRALSPQTGVASSELQKYGVYEIKELFFCENKGDYNEGRISFNAPRFSTNPWDRYSSNPSIHDKHLFLEELTQNELTSRVTPQLVEALAGRIGHKDTSVSSITMLLDLFKEHPELFKLQQYRVFLYAHLFFDPNFLEKALKEYPFLADELVDFFKEMETYLADEFKISVTDPNSQVNERVAVGEGLLILFDLHQRTLQYIQRVAPDQVKSLEELRQQIRKKNVFSFLGVFHNQLALKLKDADSNQLQKLNGTLFKAYQSSSRNEIIAIYRGLFQELQETIGINFVENLESLCQTLPEVFIASWAVQYLALSLMDSYRMEASLNEEQIKELLSCVMIDSVNMTSDTDYRAGILFPNVRSTARQVLAQHRNQIESTLKDPLKGRELAKELFTLASIPILDEMSYDASHFPLLIFRKGEDSFEIDIRTGNTTQNHKTKSSLESFYQAPLYTKLFGEQKLEGIPVASIGKEEEYLCQNGQIRLLGKAGAEARQMEIVAVSYKFSDPEGEEAWYSFTESGPVEIAPFTVWKKTGASPAEYLYLDPVTLAPKIHLNAKGEFLFTETPGKRFELADLSRSEEGKRILAFHPKTRLWKETGIENDIGIRRLELPGYKDEQGKDLEFIAVQKDGQPRWALKRNPEVLMALDQTVLSLRKFAHALVLEDAKGKRALVIPKQSWHQLTGSGSNPSESITETVCLSFPLEKGVPQVRNSVEHTLFLAYLFLAQAEKVEDFMKVMEMLKASARFDSYTSEELRLLGWLFNSSNETSDHSVQMQAVCLLTHWLVEDNRQRNPASEVWTFGISSSDSYESLPPYHGVVEHWIAFWQNAWEWKKKGVPQNLNSLTSRLINSYKSKIGHLESPLMLHNQVDSFALQRWSHYSKLIVVSELGAQGIIRKPTLQSVHVPKLTLEELAPMAEGATSPLHKNPPPYSDAWRLRSDYRLEMQFDALYKTAQSEDFSKTEELKRYLDFLRTDPNPKNHAYRLILEVALTPDFERSRDESDLICLIERLRYPGEYEKIKQNWDRSATFLKDINDTLKKIAPKPLEDLSSGGQRYQPSALRDPITPPVLKLPDRVIEPKKLKFTPSDPIKQTSAISSLSYNDYFKTPPPLEEGKTPPLAPIKPFAFTPSEEVYPTEQHRQFIADSLIQLNNDYQVGANKNQARPTHEFKNPKELLLTTLKKQQSRALSEADTRLHQMKEQMLALANKPPSSKKKQLLEKLKLTAEHKRAINENMCEALFLQNDVEAYKLATNLEDLADIEQLHQLIGNYILLNRDRDHLSEIVNVTKEALDTEKIIKELSSQKSAVKVHLEEKQEDALQRLGTLFSSKREFDPAKDHPAFMVFESRMGVFLRPEQVQKLREALPVDGKFPDVILQLIQGGGKTFVFGHILALLKADGYHLSLHVAPTAQYKTAINDMRFNSNRAFGQKEQTFEFDDDPRYFTKEYLIGLEQRLHTAIVNKEYMTVTKETLRAMRGKYLRTRRQVETYLEKTAPEKNRNRYAPPKANKNLEVQEKPTAIKFSADYFEGEYVHTIPQLQDNSTGTNDVSKEPAHIQAMESSNLILERILALIDERGVLTFDEIHIAGDPYEELNMPTGVKEKIDFAHANLISEVVIEAAAAQKDGVPLLKLSQNQQSQQNEAEFAEMKAQIITALLAKPVWQQNFGAQNHQQLASLEDFISGRSDELPEYLEREHLAAKQRDPKAATPAELAILAQLLLSEEWLKNSLALSVSEHHGFPSEESLVQDSSLARVSIPYIANMTPADGSEFSDRFVMTTNTFISYAVLGLNELQAKQLVEQQLKAAYREYNALRAEGQEITLEETKAHEQFFIVTGLDLIKVDMTRKETMETVLSALRKDTTVARELLFSFTARNELSKVNFYTEQIASHGQNTFGMGKSANGYSGSIEDPYIKPVGADFLPEEGTNGQSIDLIVRKNNDVWVVGNQPEDLLTLFNTHPQKERIRAIIDIGCQFRGVPNKTAAKMICEALDKNSPVKGVLYFDQNELHFMRNEPPDYAVKKLTGTKRETIEAETGYKPDELFTYYDQDHITGVDIVQAPDALAFGTISEHTKIHEVLQGFRRLRRADFSQRMAFTLQKGALTAIGNKIDKKNLNEMPLGPVDPEKFSSHDMILFSHLNEVDPQPDQDHLLSVQKMENFVQKAVMRKIAKLPISDKRIAFSNASYLFVKNIGVDLYRDYALKKSTASPEKYYPFLGRLILEPLQHIHFRPGQALFTPEEYAKLKRELDAIVDEAKKAAKKDVAVPLNFEKAASLNSLNVENRNRIQNRSKAQEDDEALSMEAFRAQNREGTQVQVQEQQSEEVGEQKQRQEQLQKEKAEQRQVNRRTVDTGKALSDEKGWSLDALIGATENIRPVNAQTDAPEIWRLNDLLASELPNLNRVAMDPRICVTSNFGMTYQKEAGMINPPKSAYQVIVIGDPSMEGFKIVLCTVKEANALDRLLRQSPQAEKEIRLCRVNGRLLAELGKEKTFAGDIEAFKEIFEASALRGLFLQLQYLNGRLNVLSQRKHFKEFQTMLSDSAVRKRHLEFFDTHLKAKAPPRYEMLRAYKFLME